MGQVVIVVRVIVGFLPRDLGRADLASFRRAVLVSDHIDLDGAAISHALELSGSSMLTLGFDSPHGLSRQLASFAAAAVGLALLAVVIAYLPTLYGTFSRREQLITKLTVRAGAPSSGPALLSSTWSIPNWSSSARLARTIIGCSPPKRCWTARRSCSRPATCRVPPAASYVCTQGSMPCSRSPTSSPFHTVHRNPAPRSSSRRRSSMRRSAICRASVRRHVAVVGALSASEPRRRSGKSGG